VCLEHSLILRRAQPEAWLLLGMARKRLNDPAAADAAYRAALEYDPKSTLAWQLLGLLKQAQRYYVAAIDCLTACLEAGGADAALLANLGKLYYQLGRIPESAQAYTRAAELQPANLHFRTMARRSEFLKAVHGGESVDSAIEIFKNSFSPSEHNAEKELADTLDSAFAQLSGFGHLEAAARVGKKQLELWPGNPSVSYLLKAVTGGSDLARSTPEYVVEHFDAFAEGFDAQLVGALGYDIPEKICAAVRQMTPTGRLYDTLDAGCGTGLCGPMLRPISRTLAGLDLSPKMLEQARRRGIYDNLICEDLIAFLERSRGQFNLMVAADVMIYFGDLAPIFSGAAAALRPGGLLACSTESCAGPGFRLLPSGRFAQAPAYVRALAALEFEEIFHLETTIRLEGTGRLPGDIYIFRRL
jgi:predicted TPR repeat methyltransferase